MRKVLIMKETIDIIDRPIYTDRLIPYIDKSIIKILTGQRRIGKSFILRYMMRKIKELNPDANVININLEDFAFSHVKDAQQLHEEAVSRLVDANKNYIFIDEIQEVTDFEKVLRSLQLDEKNDIYVTGSNSSMLSAEIGSRLAGRSIEIRVHPLSFEEFIQFHNLRPDNDALMSYIRYGGLPYLRNLPAKVNWNEYIEGIVNSIIFRDIVVRNSLRNGDFLQRLIMFLADNIGQIFSTKRIADFLKSQKTPLTVSSIQNYLNHIAEAYVINRSRRWDLEGKRYFEIGEKFYFEDLGIRNSIVGFKPFDLSGLLENAVYNHLAIYGYKIKTGILGASREIDFVAEKNGEVKYIQVATTVREKETANREFGNLELIRDNYEKILVTLNDSYPNSYKGIKTHSLLEFLTEFK